MKPIKEWWPATRDFFRDVWVEMKKVSWPGKNEVIGTTVVVIVACFIFGFYLFIVPVILRGTVFKRMYENMGAIRYVIMVTLLLLMALMPIKMVLRWLFNLKYFIYLPEFNANL